MNKNFYPVLLISIITLLSACKPETSLQKAFSSPVSTQQKHSPGKPGAPVSLKDSQPLYVAQTGVYEYDINLVSGFSTGLMTVAISSNEAVELVSAKTLFEFSSDATGQYLVPLTIHVRQLGRHYIQMHVSLNENGQISTRVITAIVQAGNPPVKAQKAAPLSSSATSDVISLPAQETISPQ